MSHRAMQSHLDPDADKPAPPVEATTQHGNWRLSAAERARQQQAAGPQHNAQQ